MNNNCLQLDNMYIFYYIGYIFYYIFYSKKAFDEFLRLFMDAYEMHCSFKRKQNKLLNK